METQETSPQFPRWYIDATYRGEHTQNKQYIVGILHGQGQQVVWGQSFYSLDQAKQHIHNIDTSAIITISY